MSDIEYNLIDERWIIATDERGNTESFGIRDLFEHAHELKSLSGEVPQQDLVVIRFLLAIVYAVYLRRDESGNPRETDDPDEMLDRWEALWERGRFDVDVIGGYLDEYKERFYLFHPTRPFYQAPIEVGSEYDAPKLNGSLSESGNKVRFFRPISSKSSRSMSYSEAARWVIYLNAYDDTSAKPKGSGLPSCGAGWVGKIGPVMAEGHNLFETLMLNLVLVDPDGNVVQDGVTTWESEECKCDERSKIPTPRSPIEMLTMQSRRILLKREGDRVTGYRLLGGDFIDKENAVVEQMTMWRVTKEGVLTPKRLDPSRSMWRDYQALLTKYEGEEIGRKPGIVSWLSMLVDHDMIDYSMMSLRCVGVCYGDKDFFVDDLVDDHLSINSGLLSELNDVWNSRIVGTIMKTDQCVTFLYLFAMNLEELNGSDKDHAKTIASKASQRGYAALDQPFRRWLSSIEPSDDKESRLNEWDSIMERTLLSLGREMLESASMRSMKGSDDYPDKNAFSMFRLFMNSLFKLTRREKDEQSR